MATTDFQDHAATATSELTEDLAKLAARLGCEVLQLTQLAERDAVQALSLLCRSRFEISASNDLLQSFSEAFHKLNLDPAAQVLSIDHRRTLVMAALDTLVYKARVAAVIEAPVNAARSLMQAACEATVLERKAKGLQLQLDISAQQIAQSFEEQCWLRDLARNMSISPETANAKSTGSRHPQTAFRFAAQRRTILAGARR